MVSASRNNENRREQKLGSRQTAVMWVIAVGIVLIVTLSLMPYTLKFFAPSAQTIEDAHPHGENSAAIVVSNALMPQPSAPPVLLDAAQWYAERGEELERHSILVEAVGNNQVLAAHNSDVPFNPASLTKLATTLHVLKQLGANHRFETNVFVDGTVSKDGVVNGKLYVSGADPMFGDISARVISEELKRRGIRRVTEALIVSPDFSFNYSNSAVDSAARLARALRLQAKRTEVAEESAVAAEQPGDVLLTLKSYRLRDVLLYMNAHSSNYVADRLGARVGGPEAINRFLVDEIHLPADQVKIESASGLGFNRLTASGINQIMRALLEELSRQDLRLEDVMPIASRDNSTLKHRFIGTPLEAAIVGKTGTLTSMDGGTTSLAGAVSTANGETLLFTIIDQGIEVIKNRGLEDELLLEIVNRYGTTRFFTDQPPRRQLPSEELSIESNSFGAAQRQKS